MFKPKCCCDATLYRCLEVCHLTVFASNCKNKMRRLLPKIEGFCGISETEAYQIKNEYAQRRRLRRNKFTSKSEVFPT